VNWNLTKRAPDEQTMTNKRKHIRTRLNAKVNVSHASLGTITAVLRDLSDGGLYLIADGWTPPPIGSRVQVQVTSLNGDAPVVEAEIVRIDDEGMGMRFVGSNES
jgi:hypothetical protein